ncbi:MAG: glycosyltransferase family 2 protein [Prevotellaceae bacterium]|nr:glycosyltransferase family 2 protein [Prevotellaceae bacterium]
METKNSDITVVIPVYNRINFLPDTLQSILKASRQCPSFMPAIILVDNGSTDGSHEYIRQFKEELPDDDIVVAQECRQGASFARNKGLELCKTEYIYFFDSDDEFSSSFFQETETLCKDRNEYDVIMLTTNQCIGEKTQVRPFKQTSNPAMQILSGMLSTQSMIFKTDFLRSIGGWDTRLLTWDDWELGIRTMFAYPKSIWYARTPFHRIIIHPDSITGSCFSERIHYIEKALKAAAATINHAPDTDSHKKQASAALFYRMKILAGHLLAEKNPEAADRIEALASEILPAPSLLRNTLGYLLKEYVAYGGRGGWRIAYAITGNLA